MGIRGSNRTIKIVARRYISNASIIIVKCITLKYGMLTIKNNGS